MKRLRTRLALAVAATAMVASACGGGDGGESASGERGGSTGSAGRDVTLVVSTQTSPANQALLEASGLFDDLPYEVEWVYFDGANSAIEALNAGRVDVSYALASSSVVLAQGNAPTPWTAETAPFKVVGAHTSKEFSGSTIIVKDGSRISSVQDLRGKKIGFAKGSFHHFFAAAALEQAGLDVDDVELVTMPIAEARPAYQSGALDALVTGVASAHPFVADGSSVTLATSERVLPFYSLVVAHRSALADDAKAAAITDLLERFERVEEWKEDNPDDVVELFERVEKRQRADAELSARLSPSDYVPVDAAFVATQKAQAEVFARAGLVPAGIDPSVAVDNRFHE